MIDWISAASLFGSPVGYVVVGFALYKVYNRILLAEKYAKVANHNTTIMLRSLLKERLINPDTIKEIELDT